MARDVVRSIALLTGVLLVACSDGTGPNNRLLPQGQIVAGFNHSCFLNVDGRVWCWGWGVLGQLGNGDTVSARSPVLVAGEQRFMQVDAGANHTCGLNLDGAAFCWGAEVFGELGTGNTLGFASQPTPVAGGLSFVQVAVGDGHTCGIAASSETYCWGLGLVGQLGTEGTGDASTPTAVSTSVRFSQISAGLMVTCGVSVAGPVYCWGDNTFGQLGIGTIGGFADVPAPIMGSSQFLSVSVGSFTICGITVERDAYCWGLASFGRLGSGQQDEGPTPTPSLVVGGLKYRHLVAGAQHTCAVTINDQAFCWGLNTFGKLGDDIGPSGVEPSPVSGGNSFIQTGAGSNHTCGLNLSNEVYCWGQNLIGQLGVPSQSKPTFTPRRVIF